jgi:hypothetical protein
MPIYRLLQSASYDPEQIKVIVHAYESVLADLDLTNRADPMTEMVAKKVLECARFGKIDHETLRKLTLEEFK